jgi:putative chitobiose transport system substrate-binding protein
MVVACAAMAGCARDDGDAIRLELWTLALRPTFSDYMESLCADFEAEHPGVEVVWVDVPFDAIDRKLLAAAASGRSPDVVNLNDGGAARYGALGALRPLNDLLPGDAEATYLPGALRSLRLGDEQLALPWYLTTSVRLVNRERLAAGGMTPEGVADDWSGLAEQARAYHETSGGGFLFSVPLGEMSELPTMLLADGRPPFAERDGRLVADLTREDVVAFVEAWVALYRDGALPRAAATRGHQHLVEMYQNGTLGLAQTGPNMLNRVRDANPQVYAATEVLPAVTGRLGRGHIAVMCVAVMQHTRHPELAASLAWHVTNAKNQGELAAMVPVLPSVHGAMPLATGAGDAAESGVERARAVAAAALGEAMAFTPRLETWPELRRAFDEGIKAALLEGADVRSTLAGIESDWDRLMAGQVAVTMDAVPTPEPIDEGGGR